jgi:hypothetical protein
MNSRLSTEESVGTSSYKNPRYRFEPRAAYKRPPLVLHYLIAIPFTRPSGFSLGFFHAPNWRTNMFSKKNIQQHEAPIHTGPVPTGTSLHRAVSVVAQAVAAELAKQQPDEGPSIRAQAEDVQVES